LLPIRYYDFAAESIVTAANIPTITTEEFLICLLLVIRTRIY
jgi:hypothetical protein